MTTEAAAGHAERKEKDPVKGQNRQVEFYEVNDLKPGEINRLWARKDAEVPLTPPRLCTQAMTPSIL